jgi:ABC-type transporter Mla MlaB component
MNRRRAVPFSIDNEQGKRLLNLEGSVTVQHASDLAGMLGEIPEDGVPIHVGTQGLEDIDTCILQLLYSLRRTYTGVSFDNPSEFFISAVDRCGLRRELLSVREDL